MSLKVTVTTKHDREKLERIQTVFINRAIQMHQSIWWDVFSSENFMSAVSPALFWYKKYFISSLWYLMTLLPAGIIKLGTIKEKREKLFVIHSKEHVHFDECSITTATSTGERQACNSTGRWLTIHPVTLWVANVKARSLHVAWQDVPPFVLKAKSWFSPSRAGFALYSERE